MSNDNDNTEISSNVSCNPGPSTTAQSIVDGSSEDVKINSNDEESKNSSTIVPILIANTAADETHNLNERSSFASEEIYQVTSGDTVALVEIVASTNLAAAAEDRQGILSDIPRQTRANVENRNNVTNISRRHTTGSFPEYCQMQCCQQTTPTRNLGSLIPQSTRVHRFHRCLSETSISISPLPVQPHVIHGPPPLAGAPPSYSAVMGRGPLDPVHHGRPVRIQPSPPFVAPIPPPSYGEVQGYQVERPVIVASVDQMVWGPDPLSVICPRCANVVITSTQSQRSNLTHVLALALCLCGCWPCCVLPYCMNSCKNTYHHCPSCQQFLGTYRPW